MIHVLDDELDLSHYFLLDSGKARKTAPLVAQYIEKTKKDSYLLEVNKYKSIVRDAIKAQIKSDFTILSQDMAKISQWQFEHLDFAILDDYKNLWKSTLENDNLSLKLCGAGGGGYFLGYANDIDQVISDYSDYNLIRLSNP